MPDRRLYNIRVGLLAAIFILTAVRYCDALTLGDLKSGETYQSEAIDFKGNHQLSDSDLESVVQTKTRPFYQFWKKRPDFDPITFKSDLERINRLYRANGYYDAKVTYQLKISDHLVSARINIAEGKPILVRSISITVADSAPLPKQLEPTFHVLLMKNQIFQEKQYAVGQQQLINLYQHHGYAFASATRKAQVHEGEYRADLQYYVNPGQRGVFGKTIVEGEKEVAPNLLLRELTYAPGTQFDSQQVALSRKNILKLNLFSSVQFVPSEDPTDPAVFPITIKVHEKPSHQINLLFGYNTETQLNAAVQWNMYNFLGGGRQLLIMGSYSDILSALDVKLIQPYLFSRETTGLLEFQQAQETYQTYTLNASRFRPRIQYRIDEQLTATAGWRLEYLKFDTLDPRTIAAEGGVRRQGILSGPFGNLIYNKTDDPLDPHTGEVLGFYINLADRPLGSDYRYWRTIWDARTYHPLGWQIVLADRFKLGLSDTFGPHRDIPLSERFYSGGEGSVRGYGLRRIGPLSAANEPLGGLSIVEGSVELRRPLFWKLAGAIFFDCGQVSVHPFRIPVDALQCGYGPAVSVATPVGPMRVDLGFPTRRPDNDSRWQVYFSIGQFY